MPLRPWKALPSCVANNAKALYYNDTGRRRRPLDTSIQICHNQSETTSLELFLNSVTRLPTCWVFSPMTLRPRAFLAEPSLSSTTSIRARQQREHIVDFTVHFMSVTYASTRLRLFPLLWLPHRVLHKTTSLLDILFVTTTTTSSSSSFNISAHQPKTHLLYATVYTTHILQYASTPLSPPS
jgi:hypothetical protein